MLPGNKFPMYYEVLGVPENATPELLKKSFHYRAWLLHPDTAGVNADEGMLKDVNAAYSALSDPTKRERYDLDLRRYRAAQQSTSSSGTTSSVASSPTTQPQAPRQPTAPKPPTTGQAKSSGPKRGYKPSSQATQSSASKAKSGSGASTSKPPSSGTSSSSTTAPPKSPPPKAPPRPAAPPKAAPRPKPAPSTSAKPPQPKTSPRAQSHTKVSSGSPKSYKRKESPYKVIARGLFSGALGLLAMPVIGTLMILAFAAAAWLAIGLLTLFVKYPSELMGWGMVISFLITGVYVSWQNAKEDSR